MLAKLRTSLNVVKLAPSFSCHTLSQHQSTAPTSADEVSECVQKKRKIPSFLFQRRNLLFDWPMKFHNNAEMAEAYLAKRIANDLVLDQFGDIIKNDEDRRCFETILNCYNQLKSLNLHPSAEKIDRENMVRLLEMAKTGERNQIIRTMRFILVNDFSFWLQEIRREKRRQRRREKEAKDKEIQIGCFDGDGHIQYGYWRNTMFGRYFDNSIKKCTRNHLRTAALFGQRVILDLSFDALMPPWELTSAANQLVRIFQNNRYDLIEPFDLHLCNCNFNDRVMTGLFKKIHGDYEKQFFNFHKESYLDLFPNDKFIYLTPDARKLMTEFDPNATYIIGALVGKKNTDFVTLRKAQAEGIEQLRLPVHQYLKMKVGVKREISYQGVFKILAELKKHGDWGTAITNGILEYKVKWSEVEGEMSQDETDESDCDDDQEIDESSRDDRIRNINLVS